MAKPKQSTKLMLKVLSQEPDEEGLPLILIEGNRASLEWLGRLILEHAAHPQDCGLQYLAPGTIFDRKTELGFYLHRLPCRHIVAKRTAKSARRKGGSATPKGQRK